ncbi:MAG: Asp-tRNA(Asn)/Glu-tRNA(Gln) amidotransferase subunit GatA, partial [Lachnospiraceae bacterium]|nr:Asp-tRNA(Asn)/Glu-tRNA(Gln) amidotransferase subunit GatA [Lachnospiraceae bacterium]
MDLMELTAAGLAEKIKTGETTAVQAVEAVLENIAEKEEALHCYVTIDKEGAIKRAEEVQKKIESGALLGALAGVPVAVKDNICTRGILTTCASKMLEHFVPAFDAEAVRRMEAEGMI